MVEYISLSSIINHMIEGSSVHLDDVFHALAHEARRQMLTRLATAELTVGQLAEPLSMSLAAASKHVQVLERAGLVGRNVEGRRHVCRLEPAQLQSAAAWLSFYEQFWTERLDVLESLLSEGSKAGKKTKTKKERKKS
jgi:DNA-binding transcriptional ArsR family regulator